MTSIRTAAARVALATAERLLDPDGISEPSLEGLAGTALLHARLSAVDPVFAQAADQHWAAAALQARQIPATGTGIYSSTAGLAASLILGSQYLPDPSRLAPATGQAVRWLTRHALQLAAADQDRRGAGRPFSSWAGYDLISGPAGIGRVLLAACLAGHHAAEPGLNAMLTTLTVMITSPARRPGWWIPAQPEQPTRLHPSGEAATGMAHGIAGPLAFLAAGHEAGYSTDGQAAAIRTAAAWLVRWRTGGCWPPAITGDELASGIPDPMPGRRDAWCYGAPGISAALALASRALDDDALARASQEAIASLASRPASTWDADGPALCHGHAGVLQCAAGRQPEVTSSAASAVTTAFDATHPFTIPHTGHDAAEDRPGFLTGAAGAALALADHARLPSPAVPARWDCVLLLS